MIDSHVHVWDLDAARYEWPDENVPAIHRNIELAEVLPELERQGTTGVVLVQAADTAGDTLNMQRTADRHPEVLGIVGWVEMDADEEHVETDLLALRSDPRIVGIRNLMHVKGVDDWIATPRPDAALAVFAHHGVVYDAVVSGHDELESVVRMGERHPDLTLVLDHLGKPPLGASTAAIREWRARLADCAANPRLSAKVSGLYPGGDLSAWTPAQVEEVVSVGLELFGPERLLYGGDWPLAILAGGLDRTFDAIRGATSHLDEAGRSALFDGTARRVYGLPEAAAFVRNTLE